MPPRVASLLPSATEMVCALGAGDQLVGVSHECDFPRQAVGRPVLTSSKVRLSPRSGQIDRDIRTLLKDALAVYDIDEERLAQARPDVIVTQDLCDVCAVSLDDVVAAAKALCSPDVRIVNLRPLRLAETIEPRRPDVGLGLRDIGFAQRDLAARAHREASSAAQRVVEAEDAGQALLARDLLLIRGEQRQAFLVLELLALERRRPRGPYALDDAEPGLRHARRDRNDGADSGDGFHVTLPRTRRASARGSCPCDPWGSSRRIAPRG